MGPRRDYRIVCALYAIQAGTQAAMSSLTRGSILAVLSSELQHTIFERCEECSIVDSAIARVVAAIDSD